MLEYIISMASNPLETGRGNVNAIGPGRQPNTENSIIETPPSSGGRFPRLGLALGLGAGLVYLATNGLVVRHEKQVMQGVRDGLDLIEQEGVAEGLPRGEIDRRQQSFAAGALEPLYEAIVMDQAEQNKGNNE